MDYESELFLSQADVTGGDRCASGLGPARDGCVNPGGGREGGLMLEAEKLLHQQKESIQASHHYHTRHIS